MKEEIIYESVFLWYPRIVNKKLRWMTSVFKKQLVVELYEEDCGLGSITHYDYRTLDYITKTDRFLEGI